jgi:hypothetical protein
VDIDLGEADFFGCAFNTLGEEGELAMRCCVDGSFVGLIAVGMIR